jgi:hypothetical protein
MEFFPGIILKRNKIRNSPHFSIMLATGIPIIILIAVNGRIDLLGDMYAFGLLGAFSLTCLGLDIVRYRERKAARKLAYSLQEASRNGSSASPTANGHEISLNHDHLEAVHGMEVEIIAELAAPVHTFKQRLIRLWLTTDFYLGVLTTALVFLAWSTNLVAKPLATAFGGGVALIGMAIAAINYNLTRQQGRLPVAAVTGVEGRIPDSVLAVLTAENGRNDAIIRTAVSIADGKHVVFLYLGKAGPDRIPRMFEVVDPYLDDEKAKEYFGKAESQAQKARLPRSFVYRKQATDTVSRVWHVVHPHDTIMAADLANNLNDVNPDRVRYEITGSGKVAHLLKTW